MPRGSRPGERRGGRTKGTPNRTTRQVREVIAAFAEGNADKMSGKLNEIDDPAKWMDCYLRALEYHIPKLGRQEHVGQDGGAIQVVIQKLPPEGA